MNTIVEYLQKKGFEIKEDPNAVVPEEGYNMLIEEFSADKKARIQSDNFLKERQNKEKPKSITVEEPKKEEPKPAPAVIVETPKVEPEVKETPKKEEPLIKVTRRIDLDALNKKKVEPKKEEVKPVAIVRSVADATAFQGWRMERTDEAVEALYKESFKPRKEVILDLGDHYTGYFTMKVGHMGLPADAPLRFKLTFAEVPAEKYDEITFTVAMDILLPDGGERTLTGSVKVAFE